MLFRSEQFIVDDMAHRLVLRPHGLDVVLLPNLYGDVLSDEAAATLGGMGLAPSGCYGDDFAYFESAHGSAPDIVGQGIINPTATMLSAVMLLEHLGLADGALEARLHLAVGPHQERPRLGGQVPLLDPLVRSEEHTLNSSHT